MSELPLRSIADLLDGGTPIDVVARLLGMSPIELVVAGVAHLAEHADEVTNAEHARICATLATALGPIGGEA